MKVLQVLLFIGLISGFRSSLLTDIYTGLDEAAKEVDALDGLKTMGDKIVDLHKAAKKVDASDVLKTIGDKIVKNGKTLADKILKKIPKADWINETKSFLGKVKISDIIAQKPDLAMGEIVGRWNKLLEDLNNEDKFKDGFEMYEKIFKEIKNILPKNIFKKWLEEVSSIAKQVEKTASVERLKSIVKIWDEPSFMKKKEDLEEEKQLLKEAVDRANAANKLKEKDEEEEDDDVMPIQTDKKMEEWLTKKFTKPHHKSGHSRWEKLLSKFPFVKKPVQKINHHVKKMRRKMTKMNTTELLAALKGKFAKLMKINPKKKLEVIRMPTKTKITIDTKEFAPDADDVKKLETLTPAEKTEYEEAELKWERKVLRQAEKLAKKIANRKNQESVPTTTTTTTTTKAPEINLKGMLTGNENWNLLKSKLIPWEEDDEDDDDDDNDDDDDSDIAHVQSQSTHTQLANAKMLEDSKLDKINLRNKEDFAKRLADQEIEWYNIKKKLTNKLKMLA